MQILVPDDTVFMEKLTGIEDPLLDRVPWRGVADQPGVVRRGRGPG